MSKTPLLDTHIWLWWLSGDKRLKPDQAEALDALSEVEVPSICAISLWEVAMLIDLGRIETQEPLETFLPSIASPEMVRIVPISPKVVLAMNTLPDSFHRDPADRLIVATALAEGLTLATQDRRIVESGVVPIWSPDNSR